ncbi:sorting nexin [Gonapodya sp. JEL0774]|nr:sorting nexin [Gonapodya sp. JEL0774]
MPPRRQLSPKSILDEELLIESFQSAGVGKAAKKHALSLYRHIWQQGLDDLQRVRELVPGLHAKAYDVIESGEFVLTTSKVTGAKNASDGSTTKLLVELQDGLSIECVIMRYGTVELRSFPDEERAKLKAAKASAADATHVNADGQVPGGEDAIVADDSDDEEQGNDTASHDQRSVASSRPTTSSVPVMKKYKSNQRATLCVSSQVGCAMGCRFCATGTMGKLADLTAGEILEQMWHARKYEQIRGVVFMGMGEPLDNYDSVLAAAESMVDTQRLALSPKRISVSTVGLVPRIVQLSHHPVGRNLSLALSLHAPTQELRERIVPTAKGYALDKILKAVDAFAEQQNGNGRVPMTSNKARRVLVEYVLIKDVNDSMDVAKQTGELLRGRRVLLNVIPYNPVESITRETGYLPPSRDSLTRFVETVRDCDVTVMVRQELGQDIGSACGQLVVEGVAKGRSVAGSRTDRADNGIVDIEDVGTSKRMAGDKRTLGVVRQRVHSKISGEKSVVADDAGSGVALTVKPLKHSRSLSGGAHPWLLFLVVALKIPDMLLKHRESEESPQVSSPELKSSIMYIKNTL